MNEINKYQLQNGMRVILIKKPNYRALSLGIYIKAGSRYDIDYSEGISHFIEHIVFEGTKKYPRGNELVELIENTGGRYNARTDVDNTYYYVHLPKDHLETGLEFLNQLVFEPLIREEDVKKEKPVIIEEIKYKNDQPEIRSARNLFEMMGGGGPLSRKVSGTKKSVGKMTTKEIREYHDIFYNPSSALLVAVGDFEENEIKERIAKLFQAKAGSGPTFNDQFKITQTKPRVELDYRQINQACIFVGSYGYGNDDDKIFPWMVLTDILGGGINSRLYQILRKEKGYSYAPESAWYSMRGVGYQLAGGGFKQDKAVESVEIIVNQLAKLAEDGINQSELDRIKRHTIGSLEIDQDSLVAINEHYGFYELLHDKKLDFNQFKDKIEAVTLDDVNRVAREVYRDDRISLSVVGPYKSKKMFEKVFRINK